MLSTLTVPLLPSVAGAGQPRHLCLSQPFRLIVACAALTLVVAWRVNVSLAATSQTEAILSGWPSSPLIECITTSAAGARFEQTTPDLIRPRVSEPSFTIKVQLEEEHQRIEGFGGAITQASGSVWRRLKTDELRDRVIQMCFGSGHQSIGASLARVPINSCDFSESSYSMDDIPGDYNLSHFDTSLPNDEATMLPMIRAALAASGTADDGEAALRLLASPWSPPAWMKSNDAMNGNGFPRGLRADAAASWAAYISEWLGAFARHGAPISMLTVQNEPLAPSPWEACYYDVDQEADFITHALGPTLAKGASTGLHPPVALLGFDDQKDQVGVWADALLSIGQPAAQFTSGIAYHWYAGDHFGTLRSAIARHPGSLFLGTEATYELTRLGDEAQPNSASHAEWIKHGVWSRGEGYAHAIIGDLTAGSAGWIDWNMLLDSNGGPNHLGNMCDAPIIASSSFDELHIHPQFWYLGHFAKHMPRGSQRLGVETLNAGGVRVVESTDSEGDGTIYNLTGAVAYGSCPPGPPEAVAVRRPDGTIALNVLNCADDAITLQIELCDARFAALRSLQSTIPPHAIQTYILQPPASL